jgi:2-polyprenyl-3-methyl-5-hydroxy-6-metoxy-1,4-benzoquinol methylase
MPSLRAQDTPCRQEDEMKSKAVRPLLALVLLVALAPALASAPQSPLGPKTTPEEIKTYEAFRAWLGQQPADVQQADDDVVYKRYSEELQRQGTSAKESAATIESLRAIGDRAEIERWNRILTAPTPSFNTEPNAFLVAMTKGVKPGRSLDVGMGQGRNTIYLAQQGWDSNGFDPADRAVAAAQEQARTLGVKITTTVARAEEFDWGTNRWDLIVLSYVGAREYVGSVTTSLRPGGMVIVEGFHRDATKTRPIGGGVVFDTNELPTIFKGFRVVRYEEPMTSSDFGRFDTKVVRLAATKP